MRRRKPVRLMKKQNSIILFIASALVFIGAVIALILLNK